MLKRLQLKPISTILCLSQHRQQGQGRLFFRNNSSSAHHANSIQILDAFASSQSNKNEILAKDYTNIFHACHKIKDPTYVIQFISKFIHSNQKTKTNVTLALQTIEKCQLPSKYILDIIHNTPKMILDDQHYTIAIAILKRHVGSEELTLQMIENLIYLPDFFPNQILVASILSSFNELPNSFYTVDSNLVIHNHMMHILQKMKEKGVTLSQHNYGACLVISARSNLPDLVTEIYGAMQRAGFADNVYNLTALMTASAHMKDYQRVLDIFQQLQNSGASIKSMTMTKVLQTCVQTQAYAIGLRILAEWLQDESSKANWEVYRAAMYLLVGAEERDEFFWKVLKALRDRVGASYKSNIPSDKIPVNMLIPCFILLYKNGLKYDLLESLPCAQLSPELMNSMVYSIAKVHVEKNDWRGLLALFERFRYDAVIIDILRSQMIGFIVGLLLNAGETEKAFLFLDENVLIMHHEGHIQGRKFFQSLAQCKASHFTKDILLHLKKSGQFFHYSLLLDAVTTYLSFDDMKTLLTFFYQDTSIHMHFSQNLLATLKEKIEGIIGQYTGPEQVEIRMLVVQLKLA